MSLPPSMYQAHIVLIPKPGKDISLCAFYRPISLLNYDLKILTKILATRLRTILPSLINIDQTGFMPGKSTDINLRRVFTHLQLPPTESSTRVMVTLDIEKALDSVAWPFMSTVLEVMGFGEVFRRWIDILYKDPTAQIKLGGALSAPFSVGRGTRQGCPLSPALFALVMEPLASALRQADGVRGIQVGSIHEKVALYADDLILFLNDPAQSLRETLTILSNFTSCSGLKVNWDKSQILPIDGAAKDIADPNLPLLWTDKIKYLGIHISTSTSDYYTLNLEPLVQRMRERLRVWVHLPLSLIGRINLFKMKLLPAFLYALRHAPVWIPKKIFRLINTVLLSFLWGSGQPRFKLTVLQRPWGEGSLACPDLHSYFVAAMLSHAHNWLISDEPNAAVVLEAARLGSYEALRNLLYRGSRAPFPLTSAMRAVIRAWTIANSLRPIPSGPYSPLWFNPQLPEFGSIPDPGVWACKDIKYINQICIEGKLQTFDRFKQQYNLPNSHLFRFLQLRHAIQHSVCKCFRGLLHLESGDSPQR